MTRIIRYLSQGKSMAFLLAVLLTLQVVVMPTYAIEEDAKSDLATDSSLVIDNDKEMTVNDTVSGTDSGNQDGRIVETVAEAATEESIFVAEDFKYTIDTYEAKLITDEYQFVHNIDKGVILEDLTASGEAKVAANGGKLVIPDEIEGYPVTVIELIGYHQSGLKSVSMPNTVEAIMGSAFWGSDLHEIDLSDNLVFLYGNAFRDNSNLIEIEFPETLKVIGELAFDACTSLTTAILPSQLEYLGGYAFYECPLRNSSRTDALTLTIPGTVSKLDIGTFTDGHWNFLEVEEGVTDFVAYWFYTEAGLKVATLPSTLQTINYENRPAVFYNTPWYAFINNSDTPIQITKTVATYEWSADRKHETPAALGEPTAQYVEFTGSLYSKYYNLAVQLEDGIAFQGGTDFQDGTSTLYALSLMTKEEFLEFLNKEENIPTKEGYNFVSWDTSGFDSGENALAWEELPIPLDGSAKGVYLVDNLVGITPIFEQKQAHYTVNFDLDGGTQTGGGALNQTTISDESSGKETISNPPTATKSGFNFAGWVDKNDASLSVANLLDITQNLELKALWTPVEPADETFNVTYKGNGGLTPDGAASVVDTVPLDTFVLKSRNIFRRSGYTLLGWELSIAGNQADTLLMPGTTVPHSITMGSQTIDYADFAQLDAEFTLTAQWKRLSSGGGSSIDEDEPIEEIKPIEPIDDGTAIIDETDKPNVQTGAVI
ncbi:MAG: leucine-rich repeat protein [Candidatus Fimivivens sp.]